MRTALVMSLILAATPLSAATPDGWSKLMTPTELAAVLDGAPDVRVLHVGSGYGDGHVPGAIEAPLSSLRGELENPGAIPPLDEVFEIMRGWGLTAETPVVVVHDGAGSGDFGNAARVYWSLKSLGVADIAILNGGFAGWVEAGLPTSAEPMAPSASAWDPEPTGRWRISTAALRETIDAGGRATPVDARPEPFFQGLQMHAAATRPGTLPGAISLPFETWFDGAEMRPSAEVRASVEAAGLFDAEAPVVAFCNTGIFAATAWFALNEIAEVPDVKLYAESMVEWSQTDGAMENVPGRVEHYWRMFSGWVTDLVS